MRAGIQRAKTAAAFDAHHIKVGNIPETPCELDRLIEEYAALCDDAAQHTDARIAYEIIPFDPNVHTLDAGLRLVTEAGRPNGGLAIDTWHMGKLQIAPEELKRIPGEYLAWVELSDGPVEYMDDPIDEVINHRRLPGEGEFVYYEDEPVPVTQVTPKYPDFARDAQIQGRVVLHVLVGKDGRVKNVKVIRSVKGLDDAAELLSWWREFGPAQPDELNGLMDQAGYDKYVKGLH